MKVVVASNNKGKIKEFKAILEPLGFEIVLASEMGIDLSEIVEDGNTFEDNSKIKSKYIYDKTHMMSIADDSGLCIESLPDILGVYSARFMGEDTSYDIKNIEVLRLLEDKENRNAAFHSVISVCYDDIDWSFEGIVEGVITMAPSGTGGFGYDPIFMPKGYTETFGTLDDTVKNNISHRAIALKKMAAHFKKVYHEE